jgi:hypothetical protein
MRKEQAGRQLGHAGTRPKKYVGLSHMLYTIYTSLSHLEHCNDRRPNILPCYLPVLLPSLGA